MPTRQPVACPYSPRLSLRPYGARLGSIDDGPARAALDPMWLAPPRFRPISCRWPVMPCCPCSPLSRCDWSARLRPSTAARGLRSSD
jgi:hypothetical protein